MRQGIRALGCTVTISTLILFVFLVSAFYSAVTTIISQVAMLGEFQTSLIDNGVVLSMPLTVNNTGYYDMSSFQVTATMRTAEGTILVEESTVIPEVPRGHSESRMHNLTLSLTDILANNTDLLFSDTELKMDFSIGFRYAYALSLQIHIANTSMPWGAPLHNLELRGVSVPAYNETHLMLEMFLELENHSFLDIGGILHLKVFTESGEHIGDGTGFFHIPPDEQLTEPVPAFVELTDPLCFTGNGYIEVYLEIPVLEEPIEIGRAEYG
jgi:hypothetical protein